MMKIKKHPSLAKMIALFSASFLILVTIIGLTLSSILSETVEQTTLKTLLGSHFDLFEQRIQREPSYQIQSTRAIKLIDLGQPPSDFSQLVGFELGFYDDIVAGDQEFAVMIRQVGPKRLAFAIDITEFERQEEMASISAIVITTGLLLLALGLLIYGTHRMFKPFSNLARQVRAMDPRESISPLSLTKPVSLELCDIAQALTSYANRTQELTQRERDFVVSTNHQLRTTIAVLRSTTEIYLEKHREIPDVSESLSRVLHMIERLEHLIALLMILAREPQSVIEQSESVEVTQVLADQIAAQMEFAQGKGLTLRLIHDVALKVKAPQIAVEAIIGHLLRQAIDNSSGGEILVRLNESGSLSILEPTATLSPKEISSRFAERARRRGANTTALEPNLIKRLCEHLGWQFNTTVLDGEPSEHTVRFSRLSETTSAHRD